MGLLGPPGVHFGTATGGFKLLGLAEKVLHTCSQTEEFHHFSLQNAKAERAPFLQTRCYAYAMLMLCSSKTSVWPRKPRNFIIFSLQNAKAERAPFLQTLCYAYAYAMLMLCSSKTGASWSLLGPPGNHFGPPRALWRAWGAPAEHAFH